ncbi:hypothetical protein ACSBR2_014959 [Camellia fascicularis]
MFYNQLQGNIPLDIGLSLPNLKYLGLASNRITGPLPVSLSNISGLEDSCPLSEYLEIPVLLQNISAMP